LAFEHRLHPAGNREEHALLDRDSEQQISDWIQENAERRTPVTKPQTKYYHISQFQTPITHGWANLLVCRYRDEIIHTKSVLQGEQRWQMPQTFPHRSVQKLKENIQRCTSELVFNLDEVGISVRNGFGLGVESEPIILTWKSC
jgi:hypothetical protein